MNWRTRKLTASLYYDGVLKNTLTEELAFTFNTSEAVSGALNEANVVISGLKTDTMFSLATSNTQWVKNWVQNRLVIEAGYDSGSKGVVFDGTIMEARPDLSKADYSITLKAMSMFSELTKVKSYTYAGDTPVNTIARKLGTDLGLVLVSDIDDTVTISNFLLRDQNAVMGLRALAQATGFDIFESKGRLYVKKRGEGLKKLPQLTIPQTEIIGVPEPTPTGVIITMRLNSSYQTGQKVKVNSLKYPLLNSYDFYISTLSHAGQTRGSEWTTRLNLMKEGLGFYR